ncbi:MAG: O-antigen ligase family protein, partial [Planctomycetota bacterium]
VLVLAPLPLLLRQAPGTPAGGAPAAVEAPAGTRAGDTLAVRFRIYERVLFDMLPDAMPLGVGGGNFRVAFPRYRDPAEIAMSSRDGAITTRVTTAHNDVLQLLVELGLPGAVFLTLFLVELGRLLASRTMHPLGAAALLAFLPLVGSRAPLQNASAALCFLLALQLSLPPEAARPWCRFPRFVLPLLGLLLLSPGAMMLAGEQEGAAFVRAQAAARATAPDDPAYAARLGAVVGTLDAAVARDPLEPDWRLLRAQILRRNAADLAVLHPEWGGEARIRARALYDLDRVLDRRPFEYMALAEAGAHGLEEFRQGFAGTKLREQARAAIETLLELYPGHPQATALKETYERYARIYDVLGLPRGDPKWQEGRAFLGRWLASDPGNRTLLYLDLWFRLTSLHADEDVEPILDRLVRLGNADLFAEVLSKLQVSIGKAQPGSLPLLLRLQDRVREAARDRYPADQRFR